jgi:hypothetical protein
MMNVLDATLDVITMVLIAMNLATTILTAVLAQPKLNECRSQTQDRSRTTPKPK